FFSFLCCFSFSSLFPYTTLFRSCRCCCYHLLDLCVLTVRSAVSLSQYHSHVARNHVPQYAPIHYSYLLIDSLRQQVEGAREVVRSEEHTSELQSRFDLVCRLLLE